MRNTVYSTVPSSFSQQPRDVVPPSTTLDQHSTNIALTSEFAALFLIEHLQISSEVNFESFERGQLISVFKLNFSRQISIDIYEMCWCEY